MRKVTFFLTVILLLHGSVGFGQDPVIVSDTTFTTDSTLKEIEKEIREKHSPRKAALRSAILPGLGQAYNKKYWKIPIVWAAIGTTTGVLIYNLNNYRDTRYAYKLKYANDTGGDTTGYYLIKPELVPLSTESVRYYRDQFRRDVDLSILFLLLFWGLNVVDAAVDAHLKGFDISPDLSMKVKPYYTPSPVGHSGGLSLVFKLKKR